MEEGEHERLSEAFRSEMRRRGWTGKRTAEAVEASQSDVSAIVRGRTRRVLKIERLHALLERLEGQPEG